MVEDTSNLSFHQLLGNSLPESQIGDPSVVSSIYCCISVLCVCLCVCVRVLSHVQLFATPWSAAHQAPPSMGFSRQEYWSCHFLLQGIFPTQESNLVSQIATIVFAVTLWVSYLGCGQLVVSFSGLI